MAAAHAQLQQAWSLLAAGKNAEALPLAAAVLAAAPGDVSALACHGMALWGVSGNNDTSLAELERAVALAPDVSQLRFNYATLLNAAMRLDDAAEQYRQALRIRPDDPQAFYQLSRVMKFREPVPVIATMERVFADPTVVAGERELLAFALAKAFDDLDVPDKAMHYAIEGNRMGKRSWNVGYAETMLSELRVLVAADTFRKMKTSGHPTRAPLFIVGMPRSGTTLIETILSRHPDVLALGESRQIPDIDQAARFKRGNSSGLDVSSGLSRDWLRVRAEQAVKGWAGRGKTAYPIVTDKMPDNAFALGLIAQVFPKARVIYARRHPLDNGVSNFMNRYAQQQGFSFRLDWIGTRARHLSDTMALWKQGLDLPILDVSYENLVADPPAQIRRIAEFAGLAWTDALLTPEQAARDAQTASRWQVRQPIYRSSVERWRRYEPWLGPMIEAMGGMDWIDAEMAAARALT